MVRVIVVFSLLCSTALVGLEEDTTAVDSEEELSSSSGAPIVKLEPKIRVEPVEKNNVFISTEDIIPFLKQALVLDNKEQFEQAPYIVSEVGGELVSGRGATIYVQGVIDPEEPIYDIYSKKGKAHFHPITGEMLGYEVSVIGTAELRALSDPTTFEIVSAREGIEAGSRLFPSFAAELPLSLTLTPAKVKKIGYILSTQGHQEIGENQVVVISLGEREGLEEGNVLTIREPGKKVPDPTSLSFNPSKIQLPDRDCGRLLVFKTYEKLSLGIVIEAKGIIRLLDIVKSP